MKRTEQGDNLRAYLPGLYPLGVILLLAPIVDVVTRVLPLRGWDVGWRFGALGMAFDSMITSLLGVALLITVAAFLGHVKTRRSLGALALFGGVCAVASIGLFSLDYLQLRSEVDPRTLGGFDLAALKALFEGVLATVALWFLGKRAVKAGVSPSNDRLVIKAEKEVLA